MKENLIPSVRFVLHGAHGWSGEGGYVNDPDDPGRATNHGITIVTLSQWLGRRATEREVMQLSEETAAQIYDKNYFGPSGASELPSGLDLLAFDIAVNSGVGEAHRLLDRCQHGSAQERIKALHNERLRYWQGLSTWWKFGGGWRSRENAARARALELASGGLTSA